jgi:hypothetical protein
MRPRKFLPPVKSPKLATSALGRSGIKFKALVVAGTVSGQFGPLQFRLEFHNDLTLQTVPKLLRDRVGDIRIQPGATLGVDWQTPLGNANPTMIAEPRFEVVLGLTARTVSCHFSTGHRDKQPRLALNNAQISNNKAFSKGNAAEAAQAVVGFLDELDPNLGYFHSPAPSLPASRRLAPRQPACVHLFTTGYALLLTQFRPPKRPGDSLSVSLAKHVYLLSKRVLALCRGTLALCRGTMGRAAIKLTILRAENSSYHRTADFTPANFWASASIRPTASDERKALSGIPQLKNAPPWRTKSFPQPSAQIRQNRQAGNNSLRITRHSGKTACSLWAERRATGVFGNIPK